MFHTRVLGLWLPQAGLHYRGYAYLVLPLWLPPALQLTGIGVHSRWRRWRPRPGHCRCGYWLDHLESARCPECGRRRGDGTPGTHGVRS